MRSVAALEAEVGAQVRELRLRADLTQDAVADGAGISVNTLRALEAGDGSRLHTLVSVLRVLGRDDWLATLAPAQPPNPMATLRARREGATPAEQPRQRARRRKAAR